MVSYASHDPRVVTIFEVLAASQTDVFFNHLYNGARARTGGSLTDEYVRRVHTYVTAVKTDPRCYDRVLQGAHAYYTHTTRHTALGFPGFVDQVVGVCVPTNYFGRLTAHNKEEVMSGVICDLVANLGARATAPDMLGRIVDSHMQDPEATVRLLQDAGVKALLTRRADIHNRFLKKAGQARGAEDPELLGDYKKALQRLAKEKVEALQRAEAAAREAAQCRERLREARAREAKLVKVVRLLRRGRDIGPAQAWQEEITPRPDRIAESALPRPAGVPRRDHTAEVSSRKISDFAGTSTSGDEGGDESSGGESSGGESGDAEGPAGKGRAGIPGAVPAQAPAPLISNMQTPGEGAGASSRKAFDALLSGAFLDEDLET